MFQSSFISFTLQRWWNEIMVITKINMKLWSPVVKNCVLIRTNWTNVFISYLSLLTNIIVHMRMIGDGKSPDQNLNNLDRSALIIYLCWCNKIVILKDNKDRYHIHTKMLRLCLNDCTSVPLCHRPRLEASLFQYIIPL